MKSKSLTTRTSACQGLGSAQFRNGREKAWFRGHAFQLLLSLTICINDPASVMQIQLIMFCIRIGRTKATLSASGDHTLADKVLCDGHIDYTGEGANGCSAPV